MRKNHKYILNIYHYLQFNEINNTIMKIPDKITPTRAYF